MKKEELKVRPKSEFWINNLSIQTNHNIDDEVEAIMKKLYIENNRKSDGKAKDPESVSVDVTGKRI
jgi:hypothetical protein